ncbi:MAG: sulfatase-like hydrolase/transferase [Spirochaetaceae bacterium]|nr:MAG: sulfatase-like hydrolase/transferase [Spirochaetaceae bacterium]
MGDIRNILFITTDQQRQDSLPCYGQEFMQTPTLDRLARQGVVFDRCSSVSPICQPARASFILGQYPLVTGVTHNFRWIRGDSPTIARAFNQAGWHTAAIGKMHFHPWDNPEGFRLRISAEDKRHYFRRDDYTLYLEKHGYTRDHPATFPGYQEQLGATVSPLPGQLHIDSFIGEMAAQWIEVRAEEPFFCWVSFNSPHDPYDPPAELADLYRDAPIPKPVGSAEELQHKPAYQSKILDFYISNLLYCTDYRNLTESSIRKIREYYLATVTLIDRQIEHILEALEARGLSESTLVVFSSDHGDHLGDHGLPFKETFYESALMVPLIVSGPGVAAGKRCRAQVNWLDLHATFLSMAGIEVPDHVQGRDINDLFAKPETSGQADPYYQIAFSELLGGAMVRTDRYKLVLCDDGDGELYDLEEQPPEINNHFLDPAFRDIKEQLSGRLASHLVGHSRVRSFGGGRHLSDADRDRCFAEIRRQIEAGKLF